MSPNIKTSHVFAKNIFKIKEIKNPLGYLNLGITLINNKSDFEGTSNYKKKDFEAWGIYFMFFKKKLIYIGSWCGNYQQSTRQIKNRVTNQRWSKHLKTDTARFLPLNFLGGYKKEENTKNKNNDDLEEFYNQKKDQIKKKYQKKLFNKSSIYEDIIENLLEINIDLKNTKQLQILYHTGADQSVNRFKVADAFWNSDLKNRNKNNILEDFEFVYFKFENFINYIDSNYLHNNFISDDKKKKFVADSFRKIFEKPLIKTFRPAANNNTDKETSKFILKKYNIDILCKDVEQKLINFYNNQSFFRE